MIVENFSARKIKLFHYIYLPSKMYQKFIKKRIQKNRLISIIINFNQISLAICLQIFQFFKIKFVKLDKSNLMKYVLNCSTII